jgi:hypothetical protein
VKRQEWVEKFAEATGVQPPAPDEVESILELAGIAAHASERTAAPVACWMAAQSGRSLPDLLEAARETG